MPNKIEEHNLNLRVENAPKLEEKEKVNVSGEVVDRRKETQGNIDGVMELNPVYRQLRSHREEILSLSDEEAKKRMIELKNTYNLKESLLLIALIIFIDDVRLLENESFVDGIVTEMRRNGEGYIDVIKEFNRTYSELPPRSQASFAKMNFNDTPIFLNFNIANSIIDPHLLMNTSILRRIAWHIITYLNYESEEYLDKINKEYAELSSDEQVRFWKMDFRGSEDIIIYLYIAKFEKKLEFLENYQFLNRIESMFSHFDRNRIRKKMIIKEYLEKIDEVYVELSSDEQARFLKRGVKNKDILEYLYLINYLKDPKLLVNGSLINQIISEIRGGNYKKYFEEFNINYGSLSSRAKEIFLEMDFYGKDVLKYLYLLNSLKDPTLLTKVGLISRIISEIQERNDKEYFEEFNINYGSLSSRAKKIFLEMDFYGKDVLKYLYLLNSLKDPTPLTKVSLINQIISEIQERNDKEYFEEFNINYGSLSSRAKEILIEIKIFTIDLLTWFYIAQNIKRERVLSSSSFMKYTGDQLKFKSQEKRIEYFEVLNRQIEEIFGLEYTKNPYVEINDPELRKILTAVIYENVRENLPKGDKLEQYVFDKAGYAVSLDGIAGYQIKEGHTLESERIDEYKTELETIGEYYGLNDEEQNSKMNEKFSQETEELIELLKTDGGFGQEFTYFSHVDFSELLIHDKLLMLILATRLRGSSKIMHIVNNLLLKYRGLIDTNNTLPIFGSYNYDSEVGKYKENLDLLIEVYGDGIDETLRGLLNMSLKKEELFNLYNVAEFEIEISKLEISINKNKIRNEDKLERAVNEVLGLPILYDRKVWMIVSRLIRQWLPKDYRNNKNIKDILMEGVKNLWEENESIPPEFLDQIYKILVESIKTVFISKELSADDIERDISKGLMYDADDILKPLLNSIEPVLHKYKNEDTGKEQKSSEKLRNIRGYFMKTPESSFARKVTHVCIQSDEMFERDYYFEMVLFDEDEYKCIGTVMLMDVEGKDGERYLWFGPNPTLTLIQQVHPRKLYDYLENTIVKFAQSNGFAGVVIPENSRLHGDCTNRIELVNFLKESKLKNDVGEYKRVDFAKNYLLDDNYSYDFGELIWER